MLSAKILALTASVFAVAQASAIPSLAARQCEGFAIPSYHVACDDGPEVCTESEVCVLDPRVAPYAEVRVCVPKEPCTVKTESVLEQGDCSSSDLWCYQTEIGGTCLLKPLGC